jgi:hypothetical protein
LINTMKYQYPTWYVEFQHHHAESCTVYFHTVIVDVLLLLIPASQPLPTKKIM